MVKAPKLDHNQYSDPKVVYKEFKNLSEIDQETVWVLGLNSDNKAILKENIYKGCSISAVCDPKLIFKHLLLKGCISFIVIHNHPSGNCEPSKEDKVVGKQLKDFGKIIDLNLLDFIIIGEGTYYSFSEGREFL